MPIKNSRINWNTERHSYTFTADDRVCALDELKDIINSLDALYLHVLLNTRHTLEPVEFKVVGNWWGSVPKINGQTFSIPQEARENIERGNKLTAAAPKMLEALEVVLDAANDRASDGLGHDLPPIVRSKIERAIAEAKEEEHG